MWPTVFLWPIKENDLTSMWVGWVCMRALFVERHETLDVLKQICLFLYKPCWQKSWFMPPITQIRGVSYQCKNRGVFVADRRK